MTTSQNTKRPGKKNQKGGPKLFVTYMQEKLAVTVMVITLALFALIMVLYNIIKTKQEDYTQIVLSQQEYDSRVIPYRRGDIVDRNGTFLATSEKVYNLILDPNQIMSNPERYLEPTLSALSQVYGYDAGELRTLIESRKDSYYIRYARQLSYDQKEAFETLKTQMNKAYSDADSKERVKGVWFEDEYKRFYPYGSLACNIIGFAQAGGETGSGGIEQYYNSQLIGVNGREYGYLNEETNLERVIKSAANGNTVVSTVDVNIQKIVEKYIDEWESTTGSNMSAAIVMNPNNGEVLAMANKNRFDLNNPRDLQNRYTDEEIWQFGIKEAIDDYRRKNPDLPKLTEDQVTQHYTDDEIRSLGTQVAWNTVWRNFCISDTYEPGSPQKIFTISAALEEGVINGNESFFCDGFQEVGGWKIKCVKKTGHGALTVTESLMQSCNDVLMQIGAMLGKERFVKYQKMFGFGSKTGIDLPGEADTSTLIYNADDMTSSDLATNSFGQNYNCTMIQMAAAYCSVINGGSYYEPHVVKQILNEQGSVVKKIEPNLVRETVSASTANFIKQALFRTVSEGTGKAAQVEGYEVGGKTGTAEKYPRGTGNYLVSFAGFAPVDDPQVLVYVIIDVPHVEDQPHSTFATNVVQKILTDVLPYMNVFPDTEIMDVPEEIENQLPQEEGISGGEGMVPEETEPETKVYETEEYVEQDGEHYQLPGELPASMEGEEGSEASRAGSGESVPSGAVQTSQRGTSGAETTSQGSQSGAAGTGQESQSGSSGQTAPSGTGQVGGSESAGTSSGSPASQPGSEGTAPSETSAAHSIPAGPDTSTEGPQSPSPSAADVTVPARTE